MHKFRNILSIDDNSIYKDKIYPISQLQKILRTDLENDGQDKKFSESPEKLVVSVTSEMNKLQYLLLKICRIFNGIKKESSDTLKLNISIDKMKTYP